MLNRHKNISTVFSIIISALLMILCIWGLFTLPVLTNNLVDASDVIGFRNNVGPAERNFIHVLAYILLVLIMAADGFLFALLLRVRRGLVFTPGSVSLIRAVSWSCIRRFMAMPPR